jgi:hypothetical protein
MSHGSAPTNERIELGTSTVRATEIYEQLLALADRIGAAYVNAYQSITAGMGDAQDWLARADGSNWLKDMPSVPSSANGAGPNGNPAEHALELTDALLEMSTKIGLAYVNAHEQAALAAADCREALAAGSRSPLVKTVASARAELIREIARTCASTAREIVE